MLSSSLSRRGRSAPRFAARMLLPVAAAFARSLSRADGRTSGDRPRDDPRADAKSADARRRRGRRAAGHSAACRNCARRRGRDANSRSPRSSRFCHGFESPRSDHDRTVAKILARAAIGRATREFLVAAEFSLGDRPGTIAIARRPRAVRAIAARPVAVFAKTFAARRVGPLLAVAFPRRIGFLVAEFPVGERPAGRASSRSARAAYGRRDYSSGGRRAACTGASRRRTILARLERTLFTIVTAWRTARERPIASAGAAHRRNPGAADGHRLALAG